MRYFIVFYQAQNNDSSFHDSVDVESETYPNKHEFEKMVDSWINVDDINAHTVNITNIIELNETDYNNWIK